MATIEKKVWSKYFQMIWDGEKTFEGRLADWECNPGDTLILKEYDPDKGYSGRKLSVKVTYVSKTKNWNYWSKDEVEKYGFQIISFEPIFQERVKMFMEEHDLNDRFDVQHRMLDLMSEVGEVSKEILKADGYGRKEYDSKSAKEKLEEELGDVFYSLIALANECDVNLNTALQKVLKKYETRIAAKNNPGSGN